MRTVMVVRNARDFLAGLIFISFGVGAMVLSACYQIGTAAKMGPGYFPFVLGGVQTVLGLVVSLRSLSIKGGARKPLSFRLRPAFLVLSSVVLFGLLLRPLGLLLSTVLLIIVASMASDEFRMKEAVINALVLLALVVIFFVYFLQFQIPLWPSFRMGLA